MTLRRSAVLPFRIRALLGRISASLTILVFVNVHEILLLHILFFIWGIVVAEVIVHELDARQLAMRMISLPRTPLPKAAMMEQALMVQLTSDIWGFEQTLLSRIVFSAL